MKQWSDERPHDPLELHVFAGSDGTATGELYEDDDGHRDLAAGHGNPAT